MKILIETIPHSAQRYPTVGDWQWTPQSWPKSPPLSEPVLRIRVSEMSNWRYEALVGLHEAIEALLCKHAGVTEAQVDTFDKHFEIERLDRAGDTSEPGDHPDAPYYIQHKSATLIEKQLAVWLGVDWSIYESELDSL